MNYLDQYDFVANSDSLHCSQATYIMAVEALSGSKRSMAEAEEATGFVEGVETWPYGMICSLAEAGFDVRHVDGLSPFELIANPEAVLRESGLDEETIAYFMRITDFSREHGYVTRAMATGRVQFEVRVPDPAEVVEGLGNAWLSIISLDAAILSGRQRDGFEGHMVLAAGLERGSVVVSDPGPPPHPRLAVSHALLTSALQSPTESSGTVTFVRQGM